MRRILLASAMLVILAWPAAGADTKPIKVLIITGDHWAHDWKKTTPFLKDLLTKAGMQVDVTQTPAKDLTTSNLAKYDAFLLNYRDSPKGPPDSRWSEESKQAFADAVAAGKGLLVYHYASSAFTGGSDFDKRYEQVIAGGWRKQGNHGKRHVFSVTVRDPQHPITRGLPAEFAHSNDELYQNSVLPPDALVLATAYSNKSLDPKNSGKHEPVVWVANYGKGRVCENVMGHDVPAMQDPGFQTLLIRGVEWVATGAAHCPVPPELKNAAGSK